MAQRSISRGRLAVVLSGALVSGCGSQSRGEDVASVSGTEKTSDGGETGQSGTSGEDVKLDVADGFDLPDVSGEGCQKVDFLFVIDNSASMASQQDELIDAFPQFIDTISSDVMAQDYRIMVVDSDGGDGVEQPQYYGCEGWPGQLGTGIRRAQSGRGPDCGFDTDARYMTPDQTDLEAAFACAARVGTAGWGLEFPMSAMASALSPELVGPGGCNDGFVRDDAVLVVTVISDDPDLDGKATDDAGMGVPQDWHDAVVAAKHGDEAAVVVLGLVPNGDPLRGTTELFVELVELFGDRGVLGEVMMPDYGPFFVEAVSKIDDACDDFVPPG